MRFDNEPHPKKDEVRTTKPPKDLNIGDGVWLAQSGSPEAKGTWRKGMPPKRQRVLFTAVYNGCTEIESPDTFAEHFERHQVTNQEMAELYGGKFTDPLPRKIFLWHFDSICKLERHLLAPFTSQEVWIRCGRSDMVQVGSL
eukprot:7014811-Karenia_brevis.AAC.1